MDEHRRFRGLLGPYVLGELEPEEERELERHLDGCPACREEAKGIRWAHRSLLREAASAPPPRLKARLMEGLPRRNRWNGRRRVRWTAAAVLVVAVAAIWSYARTFEAPPTAIAASLSPTGLAPRADGEVRLEEAGPNLRVSLDVSGLPRLEPGEYYELWFVDGEDRISGGGFTVDRRGRATVGMNAPSAAAGYPNIGITSEESPGDPRPSSIKVLGGELRES